MNPKTPKGWQALRKGTVIKKGDKFWDSQSWTVTNCIGLKVGDTSKDLVADSTYIRERKCK